MYKFNNDIQLSGITKETVLENINATDDNNIKMNILSYNVSLNKTVIDMFKEITNRDYYEILNQLINETKTIDELIHISELINNEKVSEERTDEIISGVINYLMTEIMERYSDNISYNGTLINLLLN